MVNKADWDSDEHDNSNKQNDLYKYLAALTRHQQQMIKGITANQMSFYLSLEEEDFRKHLNDNLTLAELKKLSKEEKTFRDKLLKDTMVVWRRHQEYLREVQEDTRKQREYNTIKRDEQWAPKHLEPQPIDRDKIHSVTQTSRLHEGKDITVMDAVSGVQPLRKMYKGVQVQCLKCNQLYEIKYKKYEFEQSSLLMERISKCPQCKTGQYLGHPKPETINAVVVELKDKDAFSEIDPLRIIVFGDDEPALDDTIGIERHVGDTVTVTGDVYPIALGKKHDSRVVTYLYVKHRVTFASVQYVELTAEDAKAIKRFVAYVIEKWGPDKVVDKLAEMFATSVIGYNHVKKGLLLAAASTTLDKTMKKIHAMLVGTQDLPSH